MCLPFSLPCICRQHFVRRKLFFWSCQSNGTLRRNSRDCSPTYHMCALPGSTGAGISAGAFQPNLEPAVIFSLTKAFKTNFFLSCSQLQLVNYFFFSVAFCNWFCCWSFFFSSFFNYERKNEKEERKEMNEIHELNIVICHIKADRVSFTPFIKVCTFVVVRRKLASWLVVVAVSYNS